MEPYIRCAGAAPGLFSGDYSDFWESILDRGSGDGDPLNFEGHAAIEGIAADAVGGLLRAFARALSQRVSLPVSGSVVGVPVEVGAVFYADQPLRGLACRCFRGGVRYEIDLLDVNFSADSEIAELVWRYRRWLEVADESRQPALTEQSHTVSGRGRLYTFAPSVLGLHGLARRHRPPATGRPGV